jgi:hypothetical protein
MALAYSVRFKRWRLGAPGTGLAVADRSSSFSSQTVKVREVALSGRLAPDGGIIPPRSFRTTFSQTSALSPT